MGFLALLAHQQKLTPVVVLGVWFVSSLVNQVQSSLWSSRERMLVARRDYVRIASLRRGGGILGAVIAPGLGAAMYESAGLAAPIALDAFASFLLFVLFCVTRVPSIAAGGRRRRPALSEAFRCGIRFFSQRPGMLQYFALTVVGVSLSAFCNTLIVPVNRVRYGNYGTAALATMASVAAFLGAILMSRMAPRRHWRRLRLSVVVAGLCFGAIGFGLSFELQAVVLMVMGLFSTTPSIVSAVIWQRKLHPSLAARVGSVTSLVSSGASGVAIVLVGVVVPYVQSDSAGGMPAVVSAVCAIAAVTFILIAFVSTDALKERIEEAPDWHRLEDANADLERAQ